MMPKIGRLSDSIDQILIRDGGIYKVYTVNNSQVVLTDIDSYFTDADIHVDAPFRIERMNNASRSGDIVLLMKADMSNIDQRFSTGVSCKSWHGSLNKSDSYVPFIISYPGGNKSEIEEIVTKETVCKGNYSGCNGNWKLPDIVKEIISGQYE